MNAPYHVALLQKSLGARLSARALAVVTQANLNQDSLWVLTHFEYHFDHNCFAAGHAFVAACRQRIVAWPGAHTAWQALGRLTHAVQDFYAHSNYVALWLAQHPTLAPHATIDPLAPGILNHPQLQSGKIYWVREALWQWPITRPLVHGLLPADSHAHMNLDDPSTGPLFAYAMAAAEQRTRLEFERLWAELGEKHNESVQRAFCDC